MGLQACRVAGFQGWRVDLDPKIQHKPEQKRPKIYQKWARDIDGARDIDRNAVDQCPSPIFYPFLAFPHEKTPKTKINEGGPKIDRALLTVVLRVPNGPGKGGGCKHPMSKNHNPNYWLSDTPMGQGPCEFSSFFHVVFFFKDKIEK